KLLQGNLYAAWKEAELGVSSSLTRTAIAKATGIDEDQIEDWWRETGDLGSAAAKAVEKDQQKTLFSESLTVERVQETLRELATYEGEGSQQRRIDALAGLISDADPDEARYIVRTALGHLRIGVGEGTIRDAIANAFLGGTERGVEAVERAHQVTTDFEVVARVAAESGIEGLDELDIQLFRPIKVMLAEKAESIEDGVDSVAEQGAAVYCEYKYDGIRAQIHVDGDDIVVFTRRLEDVTRQFPDVVEAVERRVDAESAILEGEIVAYEPETQDMVPFQQLSRRVKRKYDIPQMREEIPVVCFLFDALYVNGVSLLETSLRDRLERLDDVLEPEDWAIERAANRRVEDPEAIRSFYDQAVAAGQEGIMLKNLAATYQPGRRVGYMMKLKPTLETLDLVVVRAKYSEGRRRNQLGRLYLACRHPESEELLEVGRLSTGFTDEELAEVTNRLEPLIVEQDGREVSFTPEVVLEVEFEEVQESPEYGSGYALRFPRFKGFRDDLAVSDVDTVDRVEELYESQ
ncbi:MAG: ATP-dependent DNA ligase, partial [Halodesulfurarchaeum sp.]